MKIHCRYDEMVPIAELRPHPKNRNKHGEDQIERLSKLLEAHGQRAPIIVSKRSGFIVKGHGTVLSIRKLGQEVAAIVYQDFESEEEEYQFLQADNAIASWAELDLAGINLDIGELGPFDIDLLGIRNFYATPEELPQNEWDGMPECESEDKTAYRSLIVHFKDEGALRLFTEVTKIPLTEKTKYAWYPEIEIERMMDKRYVSEDT